MSVYLHNDSEATRIREWLHPDEEEPTITATSDRPPTKPSVVPVQHEAKGDDDG